MKNIDEDDFYQKQKEIVEVYNFRKKLCISMFAMAIVSAVVGFLLYYKIIYIYDSTMYELFFLWAIVPFTLSAFVQLFTLYLYKDKYREAKIHKEIYEKYFYDA